MVEGLHIGSMKKAFSHLMKTIKPQIGLSLLFLYPQLLQLHLNELLLSTIFHSQTI